MSEDIQQSRQPEPLVTDESVVVQQDLFSGVPVVVAGSPDPQETPYSPLVRTNPLTDQSSVAACASPYQQELMLRGKSEYTITCFLSDLRMFSAFVGRDTPVGRVTREQVTDWLMKLKFGVPGHTPAPKTMARRVTFLKNFFSWLTSEGVLREDPSANLILERPLPPLPELLFEDEIKRLLEASASEPRSHCLVYLVLQSGLKKEEVMGLKLEHVDLSNPHEPRITVHFAASTGKQHRERTLALPAEFASILERYRASSSSVLIAISTIFWPKSSKRPTSKSVSPCNYCVTPSPSSNCAKVYHLRPCVKSSDYPTRHGWKRARNIAAWLFPGDTLVLSPL